MRGEVSLDRLVKGQGGFCHFFRRHRLRIHIDRDRHRHRAPWQKALFIFPKTAKTEKNTSSSLQTNSYVVVFSRCFLPSVNTRARVSAQTQNTKNEFENDFSIFLSDSNTPLPHPSRHTKVHEGPRLGAGLGAGRGASRRPGPAIEDGPEFLEPLGCAQDDGGSSSPPKLGMLATRRQMQGSLKSSPRSSSRRSGDARSLAKGRSR